MHALAAALALFLLCGCTPAFFQPSAALYHTPGQFGLEYEPVEIKAADGTELFAWFLPARGPAREG